MIRDRRATIDDMGIFGDVGVYRPGMPGLVDIYRLYAARNWAYSVAQEAAMTGASRGRDWSSLIVDGNIRLDPDHVQKCRRRQWSNLPESAGEYATYVESMCGSCRMQLGEVWLDTRRARFVWRSGAGNWNSNEPAVGVYLEVPVNWLMLDMLNRRKRPFAFSRPQEWRNETFHLSFFG